MSVDAAAAPRSELIFARRWQRVWLVDVRFCEQRDADARGALARRLAVLVVAPLGLLALIRRRWILCALGV